MRKTEVFYFVYAPPDVRASMIPWWIDTQLQMVVNSGLSKIANINMVVTMPKYWTGFRSFFTINNSPNKVIAQDGDKISIKMPDGPELTFEGKLREYVAQRYPFVNILDIRDTGEASLYEGHALNQLYTWCVNEQEDVDILYIHTKGMTSMDFQVKNWLDVLNHHNIERWAECKLLLNDYDVVGVQDMLSTTNNTVSGNFWWTKSFHVKTLPDPLDIPSYNRLNNRYSYEMWIRSNRPTFQCIHNTNTEHFSTYYW